MGWEKIFANHATNKGLISKIHKQRIQLNNHTHTHKNKSKNGQKDLNRHFSKEDKIDGQQAHGKMLLIASYQRNANQNDNEVSPHTGQDGHH